MVVPLRFTAGCSGSSINDSIMRPNIAEVQISTNVCLSDFSLICVAPYTPLGADQRAAVAAIRPWTNPVGSVRP
jgi:hypothetical protein